MRRLAPVVAAALLAAVLPACGDPRGALDAVRQAIRRTERLSHSFVYNEAIAGQSVSVQGIVEDDYRYKARVVVGGVEVEDEVAVDDALAVRFLEPSLMDPFLGQADVPGESTMTAAALERLRARHWVVDPSGAPDLTAVSAQRRQIGDDPVLDSLTVLTYVEEAMGEAASVARFNADALDYIAREDRFPKPEEGSGVERYDFRPRKIVRPTQGGGGQTLPEAGNFRRMSVYVKDGLIVQVLEDTDVVNRLENLIDAFDIDVPENVPRRELASRAIDAVNQQRLAQGNQPIRVRQMSFEFVDLGRRQSVALPADATEGNLSVLKNRGVAALRAGAETKVSSGSGG